MASENTIYFYPGQGGHSHDGENSSFIDTSKYSLFDFSWGFLGDPDRRSSQATSYNSFQNFIVETVNNAVLKPAGLILQAGTVNGDSDIIANSISTRSIAADAITANEIAANTITANEIAANTITANQIAANTITAGQIAANTITANEIAANTITASEIAANTITAAQIATDAITADEIAAGTITASEIAANTITAAQIAAGAITADELSANLVLVNNIISSSGYSPGVSGWAINGNGNAEFSSASIRGVIDADTLTTPNLTISNTGAITSTNFNVTAGGNLTATGANITGTISSTFGTIAGWTLSSNTISAGSGGTQISLNSAAQFNATFNGVTTDINYQTDSAYVFRIADANNVVKISPTLVSAQNITGVSMFSLMSYDGFATLGESSADHFVDTGGTAIQNNANGTVLYRRNTDGRLMKAASKRELKKDIANIENSIDLIQKINPVSFRWKDESSLDYFTSEIREIIKSKKEYGFIAEDVEHEISELAVYDTNKDGSVLIPSMWQQNGVIALCVGSIKELLSKINTLEGRIQELENEV